MILITMSPKRWAIQTYDQTADASCIFMWKSKVFIWSFIRFLKKKIMRKCFQLLTMLLSINKKKRKETVQIEQKTMSVLLVYNKSEVATKQLEWFKNNKFSLWRHEFMMKKKKLTRENFLRLYFLFLSEFSVAHWTH